MLTVGHSSIQQFSILFSRDVTQRIDTYPIYPVITQEHMYSQAFYQPAVLGQDVIYSHSSTAVAGPPKLVYKNLNNPSGSLPSPPMRFPSPFYVSLL